MKRVRVGVVGAGWWATFAHLPLLASHPDAELVGIADRSLARAREAATAFGATHAVDDHRELLAAGVDAVIVATPHDAHHAPARDALEAGAHVLIEKPMVLDPRHGHELVELARARGRQLHVGYPFPYTRHCRLLRDRIEAGDLGRIVFASGLFATAMLPLLQGQVGAAAAAGFAVAPDADTYADPDRGGGQAFTQLTHAVSLILFLTGLEPEHVLGVSGRPDDVAVDVWNAIAFRTAAGAVASIGSVGTVVAQEQRVEEYRIFGTEGHALLQTHAGTLTLVGGDGTAQHERALADDEIYPFQAPCRRLIDATLGREPVLVPGELGAATAELVWAALESAAPTEITRG